MQTGEAAGVDATEMVLVMDGLASVEALRGKLDQAGLRWDRALDICRRQKLHRQMPFLLLHAAQLRLDLGDAERARPLAEEVASQLGVQLGRCTTMHLPDSETHVTLDDVVRATADAVTPAAGGFIDTPNQRLSITHVSPVSRAGDLSDVPVAFRNGAPLRLADVADVTEGFPPPIGDAVINDGPGLLLIVEKQPTGNTLEVTRKVEEALDALLAGLYVLLVRLLTLLLRRSCRPRTRRWWSLSPP
jgi:hypothetical protein